MARQRVRGSRASPQPESEQSPSPSPDIVPDDNIPPFFNTTFSTHRVSPLYIGPEKLTTTRLETLAQRLRDLLVGDIVRGIQIGLESTDTPTGQVGALQTVRIRWFTASSVLGHEIFSDRPVSRDLSSDAAHSAWEQLSEKQKQGLWIEIQHENAAYVALLLPGFPPDSKTKGVKPSAWAMQPGEQGTANDKTDQKQFHHLPLLLMRMPLPLKNIISDWLSTTFDCRVSRMSLGTRTITSVWESWIRAAGLPDRGPDIVITLTFNAPLLEPNDSSVPDSDDDPMDVDPPQPGLRSMEITISPRDLRRFVRTGTDIVPEPQTPPHIWETDARERRRLAGGNMDDGWAWRYKASQPFTEALGHYLDHHLALNMFHPSVRVTQISCLGFVLGQSRVKVVRLGDVTDDLSRAAWLFVTLLGERTRGTEVPQVFSA